MFIASLLFIATIQEQAKSRNLPNHLNNSCDKTILDNVSVFKICDNNDTRQDNTTDQNSVKLQNQNVAKLPEACTSSSHVNLEFSNQINEEILNKYFYCDFGYELRDENFNNKYSLHSITDQVQEIRKQHGND